MKSAATSYKIVAIDTPDIKFFVRRSRAPGEYARLKESVREIGLKIPISVRDISGWPKSERRRPGGGLYRYELICGQGRLQAFRELGINKIPAIVHDVQEAEIVGWFLAENVMRKKLSWVERAHLIEFDFNSGAEVDEIAKRYFITKNHVLKYLRILRGASRVVMEKAEGSEISMNDAEILSTLTPEDQEIVVEVLTEEGLPGTSIQPLARLAKRSAKATGKVGKEELKQRIDTLRRQHKKSQQALKVRKRWRVLGPGNLRTLLSEPEFCAALDAKGVQYQDFLDLDEE